MNIENLKEGMVIKNYKELCNILEVEYKKGNSKKSQLKELERYVRLTKVGHTIYIKEIYKDVKETEDKRKNNKGSNNNKYNKDIEAIVLAMCKETYKNDRYKYIELSTSGFMLKLNMINTNFNIGKFNMSKISSYLKIPIETVRDFYNNTSSNFEDCIIRVLRKLEDRCLIDWSHIIKIQTNKGEYRDATDNDKIIIKECEQEILKNMKLENKSKVIQQGKWNEFHNAVLILLKSTSIRRYYKAIKVLPTQKFTEILDSISLDVDNNKINLNYNVMNSTVKNAKNRQVKAIKEFTRESLHKRLIVKENLMAKDKARLMTDFVQDIEKLTNTCIQNLSLNVQDYISLEKELEGINKDEVYTLHDKEMDSDWSNVYITKKDFAGLFG